MGFYQHIQSLGKFLMGMTGIRVFQASIIIDLTADVDLYNFEEKSSLERHFVVGVWVVDPESTAQKVTQSKTATAAAVFNSAYIELKEDQDTVYARLPLRDIKKANDQGHPYYLHLGERINLSESKLYVNNSGSIGSNEVIAFNFDYVKLR